MITTEQKKRIIGEHGQGKNDTGSPAVQAGILTARIKELTEHLKRHKHDFMARRGLLQAVGQRRRLLKYLANRKPTTYLATVKKLGLKR